MNLVTLVAMMLITSFQHVVFAAADFGPARVLPKGRHQVTLRFGETSHISEKFSSGGQLEDVSRMNQRFNKDFLLKHSPEFASLLKFYNQTFPNQRPGDAFDMGALSFDGGAAARYIVPQVARGITSKWSLGIALPIVDYKTSIRANNAGVNTARAMFGMSGKDNSQMSVQLGQGETLIANGGPVAAFNMLTDKRNYKRVAPREETFVADVVVGSSYQVFESRRFDIYFLNVLTLPTGPKDDPDDLIDLNVFHRTSLKNTIYANYRPTHWMEFGIGAYYTAQFKDDVIKRVPTTENDPLPDSSTKETLDKNPGDILGVETALFFQPLDKLEVGIGYDYETKESDKYLGTRNTRYDILEKNTSTTAQTVRFKTSYTTVSSYIGGKSSIPYSVTYAYSDIFEGKNIERQQTHELLMKFYF